MRRLDGTTQRLQIDGRRGRMSFGGSPTFTIVAISGSALPPIASGSSPAKRRDKSHE